MHVKCGCNGEDCKINIAGKTFRRRSYLRYAAGAVSCGGSCDADKISRWKSADHFALQLLYIVVSYFYRQNEHGCTAVLFLF